MLQTAKRKYPMPTWITYAPYFGVKDAKRTVADAQNDNKEKDNLSLSKVGHTIINVFEWVLLNNSG